MKPRNERIKLKSTNNLLGIQWRFLKETTIPGSLPSSGLSTKSTISMDGVNELEQVISRNREFPSKIFDYLNTLERQQEVKMYNNAKKSKTVAATSSTTNADEPYTKPRERIKYGEDGDSDSDDSDPDNTRTPSPVVLWRNTARVKVATYCPPALLSAMKEEGGINTESMNSQSFQAAPSSQRKVSLNERGPNKVNRSKEQMVEWETKARKQKIRREYGTWYMPPNIWDASRKGNPFDKPNELDIEFQQKQTDLKDKVPKLFIAKEYKRFIIREAENQQQGSLSKETSHTASSGGDVASYKIPHYLSEA